MTAPEKREYFIRDMLDRGEKKSGISPLIYRLLWKIGVNIPPPLFASFLQHTLVAGIFGATFWGLVMWFMMWLTIWRENIFTVIAGGLFYGLFLTLVVRAQNCRKRRKLKLCEEWPDYEPRSNNLTQQNVDH